MGAIRTGTWAVCLGSAITALLPSKGSAQTTKGLTIVSSYIRPGTTSASAGIWGWTGATGKEYALLTSRKPGGVCVVDISAPATPKEIVFIPSSGNSIWHEVTSYRNYVYKVSQENSDGLQIINMAPLNQDKPAVKVKDLLTYFKTAHTLYVDTTVTPARLFVAYESTAGVMIFTLEDPENPKLVRTIVGEAHDMFGRGDRLYVSNQFKSTVTIWNIANVATTTPLKLAVIDFNAVDIGIGEPAKGISHNAWPSDDNKVLFTTEETAGTTIKSWDLTNMSLSSPPKLLGKYIGVSGIIGHNVYLRGNLMFVGHYTAGMRVLDVSDPVNMKEVAFHRPSASKELFGGTWGVYPWFKSGNVIHGDDVLGLFVTKLDASVTALGETAKETRRAQAGTANGMVLRSLGNGILGMRLSQAGPYVMSIHSSTGKRLFNLPGNSGSVEERFNLREQGLSNGNYVLQVRQGRMVLNSPMLLGN
jgi:choice-of-anchor B domain-containing protein